MLSLGELTAIAALGLSAFATWHSVNVGRKQARVLDLEQQVHQLTIEQRSQEMAAGERADIGCSLIPHGSRNHRLKVFNRGKAPAHNVSVTVADESDLVHRPDIDGKFPMAVLEPGQSVELLALIHMQTAPKHAIRLTWTDPDGTEQEKEIHVTV